MYQFETKINGSALEPLALHLILFDHFVAYSLIFILM